MEKRCEQSLLARGAAAEVVYCSQCRVFHVHLNAVTVHVQLVALRDLRDTLSAVIDAYERMPPAKTAAPATARPRVKVH